MRRCNQACVPLSATLVSLLVATGVARTAVAGAERGTCDPDAAGSGRQQYQMRLGPQGTWIGVNDAQQVRVEISETGVFLIPQAPGRPVWDWSVSLVGYGPPHAPQAAATQEISAADDRVELTRGRLTEWLVNGPKGLQYGLVLPPLEEPRLVHIDFALGGDLTPKVTEGGDAIAFTDEAGSPVLVERELRGMDARGREVAVRWERLETAESRPGRLRLVVEAEGHADPISVMALLVTAKGSARKAEAELPGLQASIPQAAPSNDLCSGAEVIPGSGPFPYLSEAHVITDATTIDDPPLPSCQTNLSRSVWFSFTPVASGSYALSLCADGSTGTTVDDTILAVYEASGTCAGLTEVAGGCDDDSCALGDLQSVIGHVDLVAGIPYYFVAWKYGATAPSPGMDAVQLRLSRNAPPGPAPSNDRCDGAEAIPGSGPFPYLTALTADISGATTTGDPPLPTCQPNVSRSIWYAFTPIRAGRYTFSACADGPTGTTVDDTTIAVYEAAGVCSGLAQVAGACDDDSCASEAAQSVVNDILLAAGATYYVVVWQYGVAPPAAGSTAIQLRISEEVAPANDTCGAAPSLLVNTPVSGTTANAGNDYQLPAGAQCFTGIAQSPSTAAGRDVVYTFTVPKGGRYSFRVSGYEAAKNVVAYFASSCPAGPAPATVLSCLGAANRNSGYPGEEIFCLPLEANETVYVFVDEDAATAGSPFTLEVTECREEPAANDTPGTAAVLLCGIEGSVSPAGDVDFYAVGNPPTGSRLFALLDGAAANSTDFDLRVTTGTDTLEYDDLNNDTPFGNVSPNVAATPLQGSPSYLRISHYSPGTQAEPYRLFAAVQPPADTATGEVEPNDTPAAASTGADLYFAGSLSNTADVDLFAFTAAAGDLVHVGLDLDPARNNTPFNGTLALLDGNGATLVAVNDGGSTSSVTPGTASLSANTPGSPAEGIVHRARADGTYFARVGWSSGMSGDYLLSIARNCTAGASADTDGDGVEDAFDCAPWDPSEWAVPGEATGLRLEGSPDATELHWSPPASGGGIIVYYDLLRSNTAANLEAAICLASDLTTPAATDSEVPAGLFYYLVRARNACGGNLGTGSDGTPRVAWSCP